MATGHGYGKVILLGEHFVVHGAPAVVLGLDKKIHVRVERSDRDVLPGRWDDEKTRAALGKAKELLGIGFPVHVDVHQEFPPGAGLGGSAAFSVGLIRALAEYAGKKLSREEEWRLAHELEKVYHGTPSGIDTSAAVYGGFVKFRTGDPPEVEPVPHRLGAKLVLVHVGERERNTGQLVEHVRRIKEKYPERYNRIHRKYEQAYNEFLEALRRGDVRRAGEVFNRVHELLASLGVSSERIEQAVMELRKHGAVGAKLTGAGDGGFVLGLFDDEEKASQFVERARNKYKHLLVVDV